MGASPPFCWPVTLMSSPQLEYPVTSFVTNVVLVGCDPLQHLVLTAFSLLLWCLLGSGLWARAPLPLSTSLMLGPTFASLLSWGSPASSVQVMTCQRSSRSGPRLLPWVSLIHLQSCTSQTAVTFLLLFPIWASSRLFKLRPRVTEPGGQSCLSLSDLSVRTYHQHRGNSATPPQGSRQSNPE